MKTRDRYQIADYTRAAVQLLKVSPERVLRRAGLPDNDLVSETRGFTAREWFDLWIAVESEYGKPDFAIRLGQAMARGSFAPRFSPFRAARISKWVWPGRHCSNR
ncbi:MAG: AraC family transcriptional regulator [Pelagimonas sp.]|jgi:hypothetical protein|nr:AraC family transcriptional regulator [Pelagimonas sp.]